MRLFRRYLMKDKKMENEVWKKVEGWTYYEVSNMGRVRSKSRRALQRSNGRSDNRAGKILSPSTHKDGYPWISFYEAGRKKTYSVHRLVATAFCGEPKECVHHKNNIKNDNRADNLEWTTNRQNIIEKWKLYSPTKTGAQLVKGKTVRPWRSVIWASKEQQVCLGHYDTEDEACAAYNGAIRLFQAIEYERKSDN